MERIKLRTVIPVLLLGITLAACSKSFLDNDYYKKEIFDKKNMDIYGTWQLYESGNDSVYFQAKFDRLLIYEIGNFKTMKGDSMMQKGIIEIREQSEYNLELDFMPLYSIPTSSKWIKFHGPDTLWLEDTCTGCNYHHFVRE